MKMVKSLLLGSAAGVVAMAGAQAADLPVKARPVQYVKICSLYGAGFYYIPGTDTCIKIGGFVRTEFNLNAGGSFGVMHDHNFNNRTDNWYDQRTRGGFTFDVRSQTEFGTLRAYILDSMQDDNGNGAGGSPYFHANGFANAAFIQWAGFTFGKTGSFFDFDGQPYSNQSNMWGSNQGGNGIPVWAYTAQFGNGLSASVSLENTNSRRSDIYRLNASGITTGGGGFTVTTGTGSNGNYGAYQWPDIVGNLRIDQAWGSAQVMGALHDVHAGYYSASTSAHPGDKVGWAVGAGLKLNLPMLGKGDYVIAQVTYAEGAMNYLGSDFGSGDNYFVEQNGFPTVTSTGLGQVYDAVYGSLTTPGGTYDSGLQLSKGWALTGGYEHHWNSMWKTSLYGQYGEISYNSTASAMLMYGNSITGPSTSANWSYWNIGSRTVWQPVENLDFSVDVMYNSLQTAFSGDTSTDFGTLKDKDWVSANIRVQRNFYP